MKNKSANGEVVLKKGLNSQVVRDQRFLMLICIIAIIIIVTCINPRFFTASNFVLIFHQISVVGMLTMGMGMLLLSGGIDLSIGNILALSGCVMSYMIAGEAGVASSGSVTSTLDTNAGAAAAADSGIVALAVVTGLVLALACGAVNGLIVAKSKCMPLIITLGMSNVYYGIALVITGGKYCSFNGAFEAIRQTRFVSIPGAEGGLIPVTLFIFIAVVIFTGWLMSKTKYGRRVIAIGGNEENARLCGIKVDKYKIITYAISGIFCGLGAIIFASKLDSITASAGSDYAFSALTGAIIGGITFDGGKGTILGAFLGCFFMGLLSNAMNIMNIDTNVQQIVSGAIIVGAVVMSNLDTLRRK